MVHKVCRKSELLSPLSKLFDAIFSLQCETIDGLQRGEVEELQNWATLLASGRLESLQKYVQHSYGSLTVLSVDHVGYFNKTQLCFTRRPICKRCLMTQSGFLRLNVGVFEEFISNSFFLSCCGWTGAAGSRSNSLQVDWGFLKCRNGLRAPQAACCFSQRELGLSHHHHQRLKAHSFLELSSWSSDSDRQIKYISHIVKLLCHCDWNHFWISILNFSAHKM